jgi:hypothetical protein
MEVEIDPLKVEHPFNGGIYQGFWVAREVLDDVSVYGPKDEALGFYYHPQPTNYTTFYRGQWKNGKQEGEGTMIWKVPWQGQKLVEKYEGQWIGGDMHGIGRLESADQSVSEGTFKCGEMHGHGQYYLTISVCMLPTHHNVFLAPRCTLTNFDRHLEKCVP